MAVGLVVASIKVSSLALYFSSTPRLYTLALHLGFVQSTDTKKQANWLVFLSDQYWRVVRAFSRHTFFL